MRRYWADIIAAGSFIVLSGFLIWIAREFPVGGNIFPYFSLGGIFVLSVLMITNALLDKKAGIDKKVHFDWSYESKKPLLVLALSLAHIWLIFVLGYFTSAILFYVGATAVAGVRRYKSMILAAVVLFPSLYLFFSFFLQAQLPRGLLF